VTTARIETGGQSVTILTTPLSIQVKDGVFFHQPITNPNMTTQFRVPLAGISQRTSMMEADLEDSPSRKQTKVSLGPNAANLLRQPEQIKSHDNEFMKTKSPLATSRVNTRHVMSPKSTTRKHSRPRGKKSTQNPGLDVRNSLKLGGKCSLRTAGSSHGGTSFYERARPVEIAVNS